MKTTQEEPPENGNWRDGEDHVKESIRLRNRDKVLRQPSNRRDKQSRKQRWRANAAQDEPTNWRVRDDVYSRHISRSGRPRSNSSKEAYNRGVNDNYRRDKASSSHRSRHSRSPFYGYNREVNNYNYQQQSHNYLNERTANSYSYVREPYETSIYQNPLLRTDYYSARPMRGGQRSNNLQRYT